MNMSRSLALLFGALALACLGSGCTTLMIASPEDDISWHPQGKDVDDAQAAAPQGPQGKYIVELRPERGERVRTEVDFSGVPYVQEALEKGGAIKKFRRMNVEIVRTANGRPEKMRSSYDHVHNRVPIEWDYALYPGDLIVVTEDPATMFDDMIGNALGPLSSFVGS